VTHDSLRYINILTYLLTYMHSNVYCINEHQRVIIEMAKTDKWTGNSYICYNLGLLSRVWWSLVRWLTYNSNDAINSVYRRLLRHYSITRVANAYSNIRGWQRWDENAGTYIYIVLWRHAGCVWYQHHIIS